MPELDNGTLPLGRQGLAQHVISGFPKLFLDFGVPLWEKAKVEVVKKGEEWIVTEAIGEKMVECGMSYEIFLESRMDKI